MPTVKHYARALGLALSLLLLTDSPAWSQEGHEHHEMEEERDDAPEPEESPESPAEEAEEDPDDVESYQGEEPALPEGMTLDEVLESAEQPPPEDFPDAMHDDAIRAFLLFDQLEYRYDLGDAPDQIGTEISGYVGGDYNRLWLKGEGETSWQGPVGLEGESEIDVLYGRLISPFWTVQIGAQYTNTWAENAYEDIWSGALALQGLAPGMFEVDASLYLTENLNLLADLEAEYDLRITQRLVLQPRAELNFAAQDIPERGIGIGLSQALVDLRLRYEFLREVAPYIGLRYQGLIGATADFAEASGEGASRFFILGGVRFALY
ncbi:copper resistance protein B [Lujinxingia vulgaris]|uniref:Copper resistance protein B n=1 Tax=Lujinxingia vulgaris TaxID=2600176 RepID=A0A5C6X5C2_9DELT|nr:copper resistance protein B [Lujinxingia vulgaris]TXD37000.1 copper resistance protein B [Lujinxingia vulgaris]